MRTAYEYPSRDRPQQAQRILLRGLSASSSVTSSNFGLQATHSVICRSAFTRQSPLPVCRYPVCNNNAHHRRHSSGIARPWAYTHVPAKRNIKPAARDPANELGPHRPEQAVNASHLRSLSSSTAINNLALNIIAPCFPAFLSEKTMCPFASRKTESANIYLMNWGVLKILSFS